MEKIVAEYKKILSQRNLVSAIILGFLFLFVSIAFSHWTNNYVDSKSGSQVSDIFLDNLPVMDVDSILIYGTFIFGLFMAYLLLTEPKKISFALKTLALFIFTRAIFISLTHLGPPAGQVTLNQGDLFSSMLLGNDFFFSGHAGMPYLAALIFWHEPVIRYISLAVSLIFAVCVLLGHFHYSIDVFAAFFITYSIFCLAKRIFAKDLKVFNN